MDRRRRDNEQAVVRGDGSARRWRLTGDGRRPRRRQRCGSRRRWRDSEQAVVRGDSSARRRRLMGDARGEKVAVVGGDRGA
ncbi:hypothetical protein E2562_023053 [Oryza meyeriana var. granulata]|uniref:Uncharacterized protein n=1 Tax=Oryza meyeriana var. granulata TaxID=110450 RepID=A0A6G1EYJ5_9ORYZ|nr:hypothetical protein E2562_023053 [Oryza meyeriana var. granulata]